MTSNKKLATKYTKPDAGQKVYGGWSDKGIERWRKNSARIRKARESDEGKAWEAKFRRKMCEFNNMRGQSYEEHLRLSGKRQKKKSANKPPVGVAGILDIGLPEKGDSDISVVSV